MPLLFSQNTGRVSFINEGVAAGAISLGRVRAGTDDVDPKAISFTQHRTIITRIGLAAAGNFQFLHTIGNDVFVYVFGDRMGQIMIHGLSFAQVGKDDNGQEHGFELLYKWYKENRLAMRKDPVTVTIGTKLGFQGFVLGLTGDVQDPLHRTIQFQMAIATMPDA